MTRHAPTFELRPMKMDEWDVVAELIHESTNSWYVANGKNPIFTGPTSDARLFCEVYEAWIRDVASWRSARKAERLPGLAFIIPAPLMSRSGS